MWHDGHTDLSRLLDDKWPHVVTGLLVVLGMSAVAVGKLLGLPAATEDSLVTHVLNIDRVHHFGTVELVCVVDSGLGRGESGNVL